jgi:D-galactarolactone cycloisomerase
LKIARVNFWHLRYPLTKRYGDANGLKTHRTCLVIRLETASGLVGWGETFGYRAVPQNWDEAATILEGSSFQEASSLVDRIARLDLSLAGGLDIALWDLKGKAAGMSIVDLFGGTYRAVQPAYASLQNVTEAEDVAADAIAEATRAMDLGFKSLKMKVGWHSVEADIAWVNQVVDALPEGVHLAVDANRAMTLHASRTFIGGIKHPERISWFEEPLPNTSIPPHVELRNSIDVPVAGAESMPFAMIEQAISTRAMDIINPDLVGHGGFERMRRLWTLAEANGVRLVPHVFDGQIVRVATLHFLASRPDWPEAQARYPASPLEYDISVNPLRDELLGDPLRLDSDGCVPVPQGPGLGITVNEELVRRFAVASR